jgi:hypothetical protein
MNFKILVLFVILIVPITSVFAEESCPNCTLEETRAEANEELTQFQVSVWTDKTNYEHNDTIIVTGQVSDVSSGFPVTVTVVSPLNSIVTIESLALKNNGSFETTLNTAGGMWKYDGTYTIKVNYGSAEKSNSAKVELTGGVVYTPTYSTPTSEPEQIDEIQEKIDEIEKTNSENQYTTQEREWISSGPFQIDRSEYAIGENVFLRVEGLGDFEEGSVDFMRMTSSGYSKYISIPFDGTKSSYNYYVEPQISSEKGIYSTDDLVGKWLIVFTGTNYDNLEFKITKNILPGTNTVPVQEKIPGWVKNIFLWYGQDQISETELLNALQYLISEGTLKVD